LGDQAAQPLALHQSLLAGRDSLPHRRQPSPPPGSPDDSAPPLYGSPVLEPPRSISTLRLEI
jgi:hypothetical protein